MKHRRSRTPGGRWPWVTGLVVLVLLAVLVAGVLVRDADHGAGSPAASPQPVPTAPTGSPASSGSAAAAPTLAAPGGEDPSVTAMQADVDAVLRARTRAVRDDGGPAALRTALRDVVPAQRADQTRLLRNLSVVPFASWHVRASDAADALAARRGRVTETLSVSYRLRGDAAVSRSTVRATFVRRPGGWRLAAWRPVQPQLWDLGVVRVVRRGPVLALGTTGSARLAVVAGSARQALAGVAKAWPYDWSRRATVVVPADVTSMAALLDLPRSDLDGLGAVTTSEGAVAPPRRAVRVTVNPSYFWGLSPLAQQILLRHELTHVAQYGLGARRLRGVPTWLSEGVAEYLGYLGRGVPFAVVAADLLDEVRQGKLPELPTDRAFAFGRATSGRTLAYRAGWTFCVFVADRYGPKAPFRLYRAVALADGGERARVASAVRDLAGAPLRDVVREWHAWLQARA